MIGLLSEADPRSSKISVDRILTLNQLSSHLLSLRKDCINRHGRHLLLKYMNHQLNGDIFNTPVDYIAFNLFDYLERIEIPMDLGTIKSKLQAQVYESIDNYNEDMKRVFQSRR